ncbi:OmpA family protein [Thermophagus sp. OGC60D27]|uniref:OmpA family protein n=1 Tax=Thermophagus sp. OGC60D27 TaxID=3458415 RepID=UPI00403820AB
MKELWKTITVKAGKIIVVSDYLPSFPVVKTFLSVSLWVILFSSVAWAQENPVVDAGEIVSRSEYLGEAFIVKKLGEADALYKKGYYQPAYKAYLQLVAITDELPSLNYKTGICALLGDHPDEAAEYLLKSNPEIADDYYLHLGFALQAVLKYEQAKEAFEKYFNSLSKTGKRQFRTTFNRVIRDCEYGIKNSADSIPAFVFNMGPAVNSYYDDYAAVENHKSQRIFYTSKRPQRLMEEPPKRDLFKEQILMAVYDGESAEEGLEVNSLNKRFNTAVAGISPDESILFIYRGKKRNGQIRLTDLSRNKIRRSLAISHRIDRKNDRETSFTESTDGTVFFVSDRIKKSRGGKDIWQVKRKKNGGFKKLRNAGSEINTPGDEVAVYLTSDGKTLFFASNGHPGFGGFDIFKSELNEDGEWTTPKNIGQPYNSPYDDLFFFPSSSDSLTTFISSSRPGGFGGLDILKIVKDTRCPFSLEGKVINEENGRPLLAQISLVDTLNNVQVFSGQTDSVSGNYHLSVEDTAAYVLQVAAEGFAMMRSAVPHPHKRKGVIFLDVQLKPLKHPYTVKGRISDEETDEPVQAEIIFTALKSDAVVSRIFSDPETGMYSFTFEDKIDVQMTVSAENYYEQESSLLLRKTMGLSEVKNIKLRKNVTAYTLSGVVTQENSRLAVPAVLDLSRPGEDQPFMACYADTVSGKYSLTVYEPGPFLLEVNADGYFFMNMPLLFHPDTTLKVSNFELRPMSTGASIVVDNILFTSGRATLRAASYESLNRLVRLLKENPSVKIEVSGHTDNTGSASLNKRLSRERAFAVKRYLESQGIPGDRIQYVGYGYEHPIASNATEEGRAQNRRVEIKVID